MDSTSDSHAIQRREFIQRLSSAMAAVSVGGLGTMDSTKGRYIHGQANVDVPFVLGRIDEINAAIAGDPFFEAASQWAAHRGFSPLLVRETVQALLLIGVFGDLSESDRAHPLMQRRMHESVGLFDRAVIGMTTLIEGLSREERRRVNRALSCDRMAARHFQAAFDTEGRECHVPHSRLEHFHTLWNRCVSALSRRDHSTIIDEYVDKIDKLGRRCGISPEIRRELAYNWDEGRVVRLAESCCSEYTGPNALYGSVSLQNGGDTYVEDRKTRLRRLGQTAMGVGGGIFAGGIILIGLAVTLQGNGSFLALPGVVLGTAGAIVMIIALVQITMSLNMEATAADRSIRHGADPAYNDRVREAVLWVRSQPSDSNLTLKQLTARAAVNFKVEFNDIWEQLE